MKLKEIRPILYTNQIRETVEFYTTHLGFSCAIISEGTGWAVLKRDHIEFNISFPNSHIEFSKPSFTGSFYVITESVDQLWNDLKDKVKICYPLERFEYGMLEFGIYDNNGYILQFGQAV